MKIDTICKCICGFSGTHVAVRFNGVAEFWTCPICDREWGPIEPFATTGSKKFTDADELQFARGELKAQKKDYETLWAENLRLNKLLKRYENVTMHTIGQLLDTIPPLEYANPDKH